MLKMMKFDGKYASCNDIQCYLVFTVERQRAMLKIATNNLWLHKKELNAQSET